MGDSPMLLNPKQFHRRVAHATRPIRGILVESHPGETALPIPPCQFFHNSTRNPSYASATPAGRRSVHSL